MKNQNNHLQMNHKNLKISKLQRRKPKEEREKLDLLYKRFINGDSFIWEISTIKDTR